jgi:hypothetical protein
MVAPILICSAFVYSGLLDSHEVRKNHFFGGDSRFAAKRTGEETLQGFDLAPFTLLSCLHDTRLEPAHAFVSLLPMNGMPAHFCVGGRTSN